MALNESEYTRWKRNHKAIGFDIGCIYQRHPYFKLLPYYDRPIFQILDLFDHCDINILLLQELQTKLAELREYRAISHKLQFVVSAMRDRALK